MDWILRAVVNTYRDALGAGKTAESMATVPVRAGVPAAPMVSVYTGATGTGSAGSASGKLYARVLKPATHGSPLTGYEYRLYYDNGYGIPRWRSMGVDPTAVAGLAPGAPYVFRRQGLISEEIYTFAVRAVNGVGAGYSTQVTATPGPILAPTGLEAVAGDGLVLLRWDAALTGGPVITRYETRWRLSSGWRRWSDWEEVEGGALARHHKVSGLRNGRDYTFEVRAANPAGGGLAAEASATPQAASEPSVTRLTVSFGSATYSAVEGDAGVAVSVQLWPAADRALTIPIILTPADGTEATDFSDNLGTDKTVSFVAGEWSQSFEITANEDSDTDNEQVTLTFGELPAGVDEVGTTRQATVDLLDNDDIDPDGEVLLSSSSPRVGTQLTAELTDQSGNVGNTRWQWQRRVSPVASWENVSGTPSQPFPWISIYTPQSGDLGDQLQATVVYDDADGEDKTAASDPTEAVQDETPDPPPTETPPTETPPTETPPTETPIVDRVAPVLPAVSSITCYVGEYCSYTFPSASSGTAPISYRVSAPSWATTSGRGFSGTAPSSPGTYSASLNASNAYGNDSASLTIKIKRRSVSARRVPSSPWTESGVEVLGMSRHPGLVAVAWPGRTAAGTDRYNIHWSAHRRRM